MARHFLCAAPTLFPGQPCCLHSGRVVWVQHNKNLNRIGTLCPVYVSFLHLPFEGFQNVTWHIWDAPGPGVGPRSGSGVFCADKRKLPSPSVLLSDFCRWLFGGHGGGVSFFTLRMPPSTHCGVATRRGGDGGSAVVPGGCGGCVKCGGFEAPPGGGGRWR